jgi:hypothetical protein
VGFLAIARYNREAARVNALLPQLRPAPLGGVTVEPELLNV